MSAITRIRTFASGIDTAAVRAELDELDGRSAALEILLQAAEAKQGRARRPGARAPADRCEDEDLADRIERLLRADGPASDRELAAPLGVPKRAVSAVCKQRPGRFVRSGLRDGDNIWSVPASTLS